jgi:hypothetical protein
MSRILVFAPLYDSHAAPVFAVMTRLGHEIQRFGFDKYPLHDHHVVTVSNCHPMRFSTSATPFDSGSDPFNTVWFRRSTQSDIDNLPLDETHDERQFIRRTLSAYELGVQSYLSTVCPATNQAFWVNSVHGAYRSENKMAQLEIARRVGLCIPKTLVTNDPDEVAEFRDRQDQTICKTFAVSNGWIERGKAFGIFTSILPALDQIPPNSIRVAPAIYQSYVAKEYEIRTVFMRDTHFSVRIDSQEHQSTKVDWRVMPQAFSRYDIPETLAEKCCELMRALAINFACFDFVRRPDGEYVFLEVNQAGQFLFMEEACPDLRLLDAFCHFLVHHDLHLWDAKLARFEFAEVRTWKELEEARTARMQVIEQAKRNGTLARLS